MEQLKEVELDRIYRHGMIGTLRKARKDYYCRECLKTISRGDYYWEFIKAGGGLGWIKFPDRVCRGCLEVYLERRSKCL